MPPKGAYFAYGANYGFNLTTPTPMTYVWKGRQYVVIAAGGHAKSGSRRGDEVVAFALP